MSSNALPPEIAEGAELRGKEYGWTISSFSKALVAAQALGYACQGGQFQFRLPDGSTCEMYWLDADPTDRRNGESWTDYSRRSCAEVLQKFRRLASETDFEKEASGWQVAIDPTRDLVFVAYFALEPDAASLSNEER